MRRIRGRHVLLIAICALAFAGGPAWAGPRERVGGLVVAAARRLAADVAPALGARGHRRRHVEVLRCRRRPDHASAARQPRAKPHPRHLHIGGEHRRLPVGGRRRARPEADRPASAPIARHRDARRGVDAASASTAFCTSGTTPRTAACSRTPGRGDCTGTTPEEPTTAGSYRAVDNGWYASGLIEVHQRCPVRGLADRLLDPMDFSIFYDNRRQTNCNVNASLPGDPRPPAVRRLTT